MEIPPVRKFPKGAAAPKTFLERFWQKVEKSKDCWFWIGQRNEAGYGVIRDPELKRPERASRVSWKLNYGEIPNGMCILHKCDCRACVNPHHLFLGTKSENTQDMMLKGRYKSTGSNHKNSKLTDEKVLEIIERILNGEKYTDIATLFSISQALVSGIAHKTKWRHIPRMEIRKTD